MPVLGIDIGGTQIKAGLVSDEGTVLRAEKVPTPGTLEAFGAALRAVVERLLEGVGSVAGVGIGCKGVIHPTDTTVITSPGPIRYLDGTKLSSFFPDGTRVVADNDARVALAGEIVWGAAKGCTDALMLTLGTGVGGGILSDGKILRGATGIAGHLGHYTVERDGQLCICGNRGCVETIFSARSIESEAAAVLHRAAKTSMPAGATCREVFEHAKAGDAAAQMIIDGGVSKLAGAIAGMFLMFDPQVMIIGGQVAQAGDQIFVPLREQVHARTREFLAREIPIVPSQVADSTGVLGAAAVLLYQF
ncbi:glucokinase [Bryobacterales bacterium F-183]|nr:glucokinase [Bryobacterales bacterium F-183]